VSGLAKNKRGADEICPPRVFHSRLLKGFETMKKLLAALILAVLSVSNALAQGVIPEKAMKQIIEVADMFLSAIAPGKDFQVITAKDVAVMEWDKEHGGGTVAVLWRGFPYWRFNTHDFRGGILVVRSNGSDDFDDIYVDINASDGATIDPESQIVGATKDTLILDDPESQERLTLRLVLKEYKEGDCRPGYEYIFYKYSSVAGSWENYDWEVVDRKPQKVKKWSGERVWKSGWISKDGKMYPPPEEAKAK
jgi:hypothetical protein